MGTPATSRRGRRRLCWQSRGRREQGGCWGRPGQAAAMVVQRDMASRAGDVLRLQLMASPGCQPRLSRLHLDPSPTSTPLHTLQMKDALASTSARGGILPAEQPARALQWAEPLAAAAGGKPAVGSGASPASCLGGCGSDLPKALSETAAPLPALPSEHSEVDLNALPAPAQPALGKRGFITAL